jgi:hypothetical protein
MGASSTDSLVREMARDLRQVKRVASLRVSLLFVLGLWGLVLVAFGTLSKLRADLVADLLSSPAYLSVAAGLVMIAVGGSLAALAAGIPGRDRASRGGAGAALVGLVLGGVGCGFALASVGLRHGSPMAADLSCFLHSMALAILPVLVVVGVVVRRWVVQPVLAGALSLGSAAAYGALLTQLACQSWGPRHLLLGHLAVPVVLALVGVLPLALLLRRTAR